ncbi:MAG: alpha/beta hydrolase-fold protein [Saprospiraceae bacterium]|nr:alpha/beta hydrolase-fold protein [Saprospiraceae bacterium]
MKQGVLQTVWYVAIALLLSLTAAGQVTIVITAVPDNTPTGAQLYLAGSMQGWDPGAENYRFEKIHDTYTLTIHPEQGRHEYKITRGTWDLGETTADGGHLPNRTFAYEGRPLRIEIMVAGWSDGRQLQRASTASANVWILHHSFRMPQLDRERRVWIYLPPGYETSTRSYPVLYMHDGQNVFDASTSYAGEWRVDETLDSLHRLGMPGCIVVAVDNGQQRRVDEYSPWVHPEYGGGEGAAYVDFLVETLKPYIDSTHRTLPDRAHTGIMGSSMGGLISLYAALRYPEVFGLVGSFSPAYWFSDQAREQAANTTPKSGQKIYTIVGELEGEHYVNEARNVQEALLAAGHDPAHLTLIVHPDGEHREWYWAREFPKACLWLFGDR